MDIRRPSSHHMRIPTPYLSLMLVVVLLAVTWSCGQSTPDLPDQIIIYSLDGTNRDDKPPGEGENYFGYPVLGSVTVEDPEIRREVIKSVMVAIAYPREGPAEKCFEPRHGLALTTNGQKIDYVICFQCGNFKVFPGSSYSRQFGDQPKALFSKLLADAGVPVVP